MMGISPPPPPKARILDVDISLTSCIEAADLLMAWGRTGISTYVAVCNVHTVIEAHRHPPYADVLNRAAIATPDGMPLVWCLRRKGYRSQERVYGPDLLQTFASRVASTSPDIQSYFYGGEEGVAQRLASVLEHSYPGFQSVGAESPPFRPLTPDEDEATVKRINDSGAAILWIGLGAPKQEWWMAEHLGRIRPVMVGVGAAFDFLTGRKRQAPRWMMRIGLEWLFRLATEPRRLWKRYLLSNSLFLWYLWRNQL